LRAFLFLPDVGKLEAEAGNAQAFAFQALRPFLADPVIAFGGIAQRHPLRRPAEEVPPQVIALPVVQHNGHPDFPSAAVMQLFGERAL